MLVLDLHNFLTEDLTCPVTTTLEDILHLCQTGPCDRPNPTQSIMLVNADRYPLGTIDWLRLIPHIVANRAFSPRSAIWTGQIRGMPKPLPNSDRLRLIDLHPCPIDPVAILPATIELTQLWTYFNNEATPVPYAIVDGERRFLGLLDTLRLLQFLGQRLNATPSSANWQQEIAHHEQVTRQLAAKNADLWQSNRLKDELLASISHELKTPLTSVSSLSHLLKDRRLGQLSARQAQYAQLIYQSSRQLMRVVNRISDLSRIENGQLELNLEKTEIRPICDRAYQQTLALQDELEVLPKPKYTLDIVPEAQTLVADPLRLTQMLVNLLSNALKFTPAEGQIGLQVRRWGVWVAFTVWDTGIGISASQQPWIFQRFQPLENPLTRQFEGTGLGLVLAQRLAQLHDGEITFTSQAGQGSQFTLLLPVHPKRTTTDKGKKLVLLVTTSTPLLAELTDRLVGWGYYMTIARSGTEALSKARQLQPCSIIIEPQIPQLSGWDVLTLLKADETTRSLKVVIVSSETDRNRAQRDRADGFLSLPLQEADLRNTLSACSVSPSHLSKQLTLLWLTPENQTHLAPSAERTDLSTLLHQHHCRVLEVDDLEQADLLARVWKPHVVLLDNTMAQTNAPVYLEELSKYSYLSSLPLVTLDAETTQAANLVLNRDGKPVLQVFPCLAHSPICQSAGDRTCSIPTLLQVIQVAAGMG
jgi:signal transduction histidine kinase/CheY-like chemotaxis protein